MTTTITTAEYRKLGPWTEAGRLAGDKLFSSTHSDGNFPYFLTEAEHKVHAAAVAEQDAKIEAFKREVLGETEESK